MSDRFARLKTDPRFRKPKRHANKVKIDPRFQSVLEAKPNKKGSGRVDKYGRKLAATHEEDELRKFYRLDVEEEEEEKKEKKKKRKPMTGLDYARGEALMESSSEDSDPSRGRKRGEGDEDEEDESGSDWGSDVVLGEDSSRPITVRELEDQAGEIDLDESQFAFLDQEAARNLDEADQDTNAIITQRDGIKPTNRIAAINLDWDHVKATHLFRIFSSLLSLHPSSSTTNTKKSLDAGANRVHGELLHVRIYPSDFGKKKMAEEDKSGPPTDLFVKKKKKGEDSSNSNLPIPIQRLEDEEENENDVDVVPRPNNNNGEEYDQSALRRYQLERLRYYYAIATFSSISAASYVYSELDGTELERSANLFDLSYVPDDMTFEEDEKREEATRESMVTVKDHKGLDFTTDALRHSKVKLTWDDDDPERVKMTRRALSEKEIEEMDFRALIASSSSSSSSENDDDNHHQVNGKGGDLNKKGLKKEKAKERADRLRALLLNGNEENVPEGWGGGSKGKIGEAGEMEITFIPGLSAPDADKGDGKKLKKGGEQEETTLERYQRKEREKKKAKKEKRKEQLRSTQIQDVGEDESDGSDVVDDGAQTRKNGKKGHIDGDGFFGSDSGTDEENYTSKSKRGKKSKPKGETFTPATGAELALLVDDENDFMGTKRAKHFDMNEIVRTERKREKGGSSKWDKKKEKKKRKREDEGASASARSVEDDIELNMTDPRFKAIHEDHRFAIDPANPHFKKTKNMKKLLYGKDPDDGVANGDRKKKRQRKI